MLYSYTGDKDFVIEVEEVDSTLDDYRVVRIIKNDKRLRMNFWIQQENKIDLKTIAKLNNIEYDYMMMKKWMKPYDKNFRFLISKDKLKSDFIIFEYPSDDKYDELEKLLFD